MKRLILLFLFGILLFPLNTFAQEIGVDGGFEVVSTKEKYYKTTIFYNNELSVNTMTNVKNDNVTSITEEVTKEEYDLSSSSVSPQVSSTVEVSYKKLTSTILSNGSYYRYKATLNWKSIPSFRGTDSIAIGHYASVKIKGDVQFSQTSCDSSGTCQTTSNFYPQTFDTGSSATFVLPTGTLSSLSQTIYFDVQKAVDTKIISQEAAGDYAHAIKMTPPLQVTNFTVSTVGINYKSSTIGNLYEEMPVATAFWEGSW